VRARLAIPLVVLAATLPMLAGYALPGSADEPTPLGPGVVTVEVTMRHSRYSVDDLRVYEGTLVRFVMVNDDPIHHEFVAGDSDVHAAHAKGTDKFHPPVPGEVSVEPGETGFTAYLFDEPGTTLFACHLPGHYEYGMKGEVEVVPVPEG
jgi:uncharacterized cupredoxin-like copper-binding protein